MGCWYETCCITRLPIHEGTEVVMIDFHNNPDPKERHYFFDKLKVRRVLKGTYNDYGSINELDEATQSQEHKERPWRAFILKTAWDEVCKLYPRYLGGQELHAKRAAEIDDIFSLNLMDPYNRLRDLAKTIQGAKELTEEYLSVIYFMEAARLTFDGAWTTGQDCHLTAHSDRLKITQQCTKEYYQSMEDFCDEEEWALETRNVFCFNGDEPKGWWSKSFAISQGWRYCEAGNIVNSK